MVGGGQGPRYSVPVLRILIALIAKGGEQRCCGIDSGSIDSTGQQALAGMGVLPIPYTARWLPRSCWL